MSAINETSVILLQSKSNKAWTEVKMYVNTCDTGEFVQTEFIITR